MDIKVILDCRIDDQRELVRHQAAFLTSMKMYNDYVVTKDNLLGIGPELFAEQWIKGNLESLPRSFEDLIVIYFVKIIMATKNG